MVAFFMVLTIIGCLLGGVELLGVMVSAKSAPQQAAGSAQAVAFAVLPYCLARAIQEIKRDSKENKRKDD